NPRPRRSSRGSAGGETGPALPTRATCPPLRKSRSPPAASAARCRAGPRLLPLPPVPPRPERRGRRTSPPYGDDTAAGDELARIGAAGPIGRARPRPQPLAGRGLQHLLVRESDGHGRRFPVGSELLRTVGEGALRLLTVVEGLLLAFDLLVGLVAL